MPCFSNFPPNIDQRRRIFVGEGAQEDGVHDTEDGGIRADAKCESEDGNEGKVASGGALNSALSARKARGREYLSAHISLRRQSYPRRC